MANTIQDGGGYKITSPLFAVTPKTRKPVGAPLPAPSAPVPAYNQQTQNALDVLRGMGGKAFEPNGGYYGGYTSNPFEDPVGGTDNTTSAATHNVTDWSSYLGLYGLPNDVAAKINDIFAKGGDVQQSVAIGLAYVRGTPWYAQTYPGIGEGIAKGLIRDEADYRSQLNQVDQMFRQFYGRSVSGLEFATFLREGIDPGTVGRRLQGQATATALGGTLPPGLFTPEELQQIGNQQAGLTSLNGEYLSGAASLGRDVAPLYAQYGKTLTRADLEGLYRSGTSASTVGRQFAGDAYANAYAPDLQYLSGNFGDGQLSATDLSAYGREQAGLDTPLGQMLTRRLDQAQARVTKVFQGVVASPVLSLSGGRLRGPAQPSDIAA